MRLLFITICTVVIYKMVLDSITMQSAEAQMWVEMLRYVGNIVLIMMLCLSIRDTIKNMQRQERISRYTLLRSTLTPISAGQPHDMTGNSFSH